MTSAQGYLTATMPMPMTNQDHCISDEAKCCGRHELQEDFRFLTIPPGAFNAKERNALGTGQRAHHIQYSSCGMMCKCGPALHTCIRMLSSLLSSCRPRPFWSTCPRLSVRSCSWASCRCPSVLRVDNDHRTTSRPRTGEESRVMESKEYYLGTALFQGSMGN